MIYTQGMTSESASAVHVYSHLSHWPYGVLGVCMWQTTCVSASAGQLNSWV